MRAVRALACAVIAVMTLLAANILVRDSLDHGVGLDVFLAGTGLPHEMRQIQLGRIGFTPQYGAQAGRKLRGEQLRALLAVLVLAVAIRLLTELVVVPGEVFSISLPSGESG